MSQHANDSLFREEVRGIFVLGVIATLLTLREFGPNVVFLANPRVTLHGLELVLSAVWGLYIFFAAIAVSKDWVWNRFADMCHVAAKINFYVGIGLLLATFVMIPISYAFGTTAGIWAGMITAFVSAIFLEATSPKPSDRIPKHDHKNQEQSKESTAP